MRTVLLVDDNDDFIELLQLALSKNYNMLVASNIDDAYELFLTEKIDVLLSDFHIGPNNATELITRLVNKNMIRNKLVILIMSGSGEIGESIFSIPIHRFMLKPFGLKELKGIIEEELSKILP